MINQKYGKLVNGVINYAPEELEINNIVYCPPAKEQYNSLGYKEIINNQQINKNCYDVSQKIIENTNQIIIDWEYIPMTNRQISNIRNFQYQTRTDILYLQYQMELTRGNVEEANILLDKWTNECSLIKQEYPYFNN